MGSLRSKYIKRVNKDLATHSVNGIFIYILGWGLVSFYSSITSYNPIFVYRIGAAIVLIGVLRLLLVRYFDFYHNRKTASHWQFLFGLGMAISASIWSLFTCWSFYHVGLSIEGIIIFLPLVMFSSGGIISLSPSKRLLITFLAILAIPQIIIFINMGTTHGYVTAFMFFVYEVFLLKLGLQINSNYWELLLAREDDIRIYANVFENSREAILITNGENQIIKVNKTLIHETGYSLDELIGQSPNILKSKYTSEQIFTEMNESIESTDHWRGELWNLSKNGEIIPKWVSISAIRNDNGEITNYFSSYTDLSSKKEADDRILKLAHHDPLTGLFNRMAMEMQAKQSLLIAKRNKHNTAIIFIDMDHFKNINDTKGHDVGDAVLKEVAKRLISSVRESDIVSRQGGDEFVVVLNELDDVMLVCPIATFIVHTLSQPYKINGHLLHSTPSIGISVYPQDGKDINLLLKHADTAMYHAKDKGRNNYQFFTQQMNSEVEQRFLLENELKIALKESQFILYFQPEIFSGDGHICGFEALIRWNHPQRGIILPDDFIPMCEETQLINHIGEWVIEKAFEQLQSWESEGYKNLTMAINISLQQFKYKNLVSFIEKKLALFSFSAKQIKLEFTESTAMSSPETIMEQLYALRKLGVQLAIDDFGTGYSSLSNLKNLPVHELKIDRSFIGNLEHDVFDKKISVATISLAHSLALKVVAEGVENEMQKDFLIAHQCEILQGYLFSKPVSALDATSLLDKEQQS